MGAAWEWTGLMELKKPLSRIHYLIITSLVFFSVLFVPVVALFYVAAVWWLLAILLIACYPRGASCWKQSTVVRGIMGLLVLTPCWAAFNYIRSQGDGIYALLYLLILIWGADSTAYFVGKKWGRHKLIPNVSPGKSIEGVLGALIFALIAVVVTLWLADIPPLLWKWGFVLSFITVFFSIVGDLLESMLKRQANLKDSGHLLPGHGGILDRIDSLTAAAPIFALGAILLGDYAG